MKRILITAILCAAIAAGFAAGEGFCRAPFARKFVALVLQRTGAVDARFVRQENLRVHSRETIIANEEIEHGVELLRDQFPDENAFINARTSARFTEDSLRADVADHLRAQHWIEAEISSQLSVGPSAMRQFYDSNASRFAQPQRYRVSHIFRAAPDGYPDEVIAAKQSDIQGLAVRLLAGENFDDLVSEASEDEATKWSGGDLNYFSAVRMPPEFIAELEKLHPGEISAPIRSHLGFHIVKLTDVKPARQLTFEEAEREIAIYLANEKRIGVVAHLTERLDAQ